MANNKLTDLHNALFAQLERVTDEDLSGEDLKEEIVRSKAVSGLSKQIILNARLTLDAAKMQYNEIPNGKVPGYLIEKQ